MSSWLRIGIVGAGALAVMLGPLLSTATSAQEGRRKVLVANLLPREDADDDFGKDLAKALRELIDELATHQAVEEKEISNTAKRFDLDMKELDCVRSQQLSRQLGANIVFCGSYTENRQAKTFTLTGVKFVPTDGAPLEIPDKTWPEDDYRLAAQEIAGLFNTFITRLHWAVFCGDYYNTKEWDRAEKYCLDVLEQAPNDTQVRLILAQVYRQSERLDQAYDEVLKVVELDPLNDEALRLAGWLATSLGRTSEGRAHNEAYLQLNPGDTGVRITIAYEMAQAGDPEGAMILMEEGLAIEPENTDLLRRHASFAIAAGQALQEEGQPLTAEATQFFEKGSESYRKAHEVLGEDMDGQDLYQMIATLNVMGRLERAVELAEEALVTHGDAANLWFLMGTVLNKLGRVDDALQALDEAEARDPNYENLKAAQGQWLLAAGREEEALSVLLEAVERGEQPADVIADLFFGAAVSKGLQLEPRDYDFALEMIDMALTFEPELSARTLGRLVFYKALSIYQQAYIQQTPQTYDSAQLTLSKFKEAQSLLGLGHVVDWVAGAPERTQQSYREMRDRVVQFIEIQELLIQRGR